VWLRGSPTGVRLSNSKRLGAPGWPGRAGVLRIEPDGVVSTVGALIADTQQRRWLVLLKAAVRDLNHHDPGPKPLTESPTGVRLAATSKAARCSSAADSRSGSKPGLRRASAAHARDASFTGYGDIATAGRRDPYGYRSRQLGASVVDSVAYRFNLNRQARRSSRFYCPASVGGSCPSRS